MMKIVGLDFAIITAVMAGLDPALPDLTRPSKDVDARHKAGHDEDCEFAP